MIEVEPLKPKIYINSFPKSGTHLAILITLHMAQVQQPKHWIGSFRDHSWTTTWLPDKYVLPVIEGQQPGTWMMGHMAYKKEYDEAFQKAGTCMFFVYRDLRDVAVSQTYHIESDDDERFKHLDKALYMELPTHEDRIKAVIEGLGKYPGLIERWKLFAPWLDVDWILPIRYEEMREYPEEVAKKAVNYVIKRTSEQRDEIPLVFGKQYEEAIAKSIGFLQTTDKSGSFRKGKVGGWKEEFNEELLESFYNTGGKYWIERLGYE